MRFCDLNRIYYKSDILYLYIGKVTQYRPFSQLLLLFFSHKGGIQPLLAQILMTQKVLSFEPAATYIVYPEERYGTRDN
jgi:hypothetical protein